MQHMKSVYVREASAVGGDCGQCGGSGAGGAGGAGPGGRGSGSSPWCCREHRPARAPGVAGNRVGGVETIRADYRS